VCNLAIVGNQVELTRLLEVHPELDVDGYKDGGGWTAFYFACFKGHTECARLLIEHKADVNAKTTSGASALHDVVYTNDNLSCGAEWG
jgi:ankyrin repeat protein